MGTICCLECSSCDVTHGKLIGNSKPAAKGQLECIQGNLGEACGLAKHRITTHTHIRIKLLIHSAVVMCVDVVRAHSGILRHVPQKLESAFPLFRWDHLCQSGDCRKNC